MASGFRSRDRSRAKELFRRLPKEITKGVETALEQNATELAAAIKRRVPVQRVGGGELRDSVTWKKGAAKDVKGKRAAGRDADLTVRVTEGSGTTGFYAGMVEFGTVNAPAQPHFFPTVKQLRRKMRSRLSRAVGKAIREAAK